MIAESLFKSNSFFYIVSLMGAVFSSAWSWTKYVYYMCYPEPVNMVGNRLWLGDHRVSRDLEWMKRNHIHTVINCTDIIPFYNPSTHNIRLSVRDRSNHEMNHKMADKLPKFAKRIAKLLQERKSILIHCRAGRQRSVTVVMAFLIMYGGYTRQEAAAFLRKCRPGIFLPYAHFDKALCEISS